MWPAGRGWIWSGAAQPRWNPSPTRCSWSAVECTSCQSRPRERERGRSLSRLKPSAGRSPSRYARALETKPGHGAGPRCRSSLKGSGFNCVCWRCPIRSNSGTSFGAELADTWILTGPPEAQHVPWHFESPSGAVHKVAAEYVGKYRWRIRFTPDEVGTWRYHWTQDFLPEPYRSATGEFRVWAGCLDEVVRHLARLDERVAATDRVDRTSLYLRLYALEREGIRLLTPARYRGADGERFRAAVRRVRSSLWGKPVPDPIPMRSHRLVTRLDSAGSQDPVLDASGYEERAKRRNPRRSGNPLRRLRSKLQRLGFRRAEPDGGNFD